MDHPQRLIYIALLIAWAIFRLIRYVRMAASRQPRQRPAPAQVSAATVTASARSPLDPVAAGGGRAASLAAVGVFLAGNLLIWPLLFMIPALDEVPAILRLIAAVLANLYLLHLARTAAARVGGARREPADDNNPIR